MKSVKKKITPVINFKISVALLILYIVIFCIIALIRFPYTYNDLLLIEKNGSIATSEGEMPVIDIAKTVNMTSFYYLLKSEDNDYYIITATRFPFCKRYDMSKLMTMKEEEIYEHSDFFNKVIITLNGDMLNFSEEKHISISVFTLPFLLFAVICNIIYDYKKYRESL